MPGTTRKDIEDAGASAFSGLSLTTTLDNDDFQKAVDAFVVAIDSYQYTVNPNSTCHPPTVRH